MINRPLQDALLEGHLQLHDGGTSLVKLGRVLFGIILHHVPRLPDVVVPKVE